jgi:RNA polymerase sigma-70 factor (ECF subfamily)
MHEAAIVALTSAAHEAGGRAWPGVTLERADFAARVASLGVTPRALAAHGADLFLAVACTAGAPAALAHFEHSFMGELPAYLSRLALAPDVLDEVRQLVRIRVLTGPDARLTTYTGAGPLGAWLRVVSMRVALNFLASRDAPQAGNEPADDLLAAGPGPDIAVLRARYGARLREALERVLADLPAREKTLLRMHFIDGVGIDGIGTLYRVHRATAARWLVAIRRQVLEGVKAQLQIDLPASSTEMRSIVSDLRPDLQLTLERVLR